MDFCSEIQSRSEDRRLKFSFLQTYAAVRAAKQPRRPALAGTRPDSYDSGDSFPGFLEQVSQITVKGLSAARGGILISGEYGIASCCGFQVPLSLPQ
jgi:hypothetical protein